MKLYLCNICELVQIPQYKSPKEIFRDDYAYLSSTSKTMCDHAKEFVKESIQNCKLTKDNFVVELASNDGYLLRNFIKKKIPCLGVEPTNLAAKIARSKKINTLTKFFSFKTSKEIVSKYGKADLIIANNVLAHVPDINDFLKGISNLLKPSGKVSIEFQHILTMLENCYWDTIYHEHFNYLSLDFVIDFVKKFNLRVFDVNEIPTHGGSLRIWLEHYKSDSKINSKSINKILKKEKKIGCNTKIPFEKMQLKAQKVKIELLEFLIKSKRKKLKIIAYGAAAKGNTLLNYVGVKKDFISNVVDNSKSKQGLYLPGSNILISSPKIINQIKPDIIFILPWNIKDEILEDLNKYKNVKKYTIVPSLKKLN